MKLVIWIIITINDDVLIYKNGTLTLNLDNGEVKENLTKVIKQYNEIKND